MLQIHTERLRTLSSEGNVEFGHFKIKMDKEKTKKQIKEHTVKVKKNISAGAAETKIFVNRNTEKIFLVSVTALLVLLLINAIVLGSAASTLNVKAAKIAELNKPSIIGLTVINCNGCVEVTGIVDSIKSQNVEISSENVYNEFQVEAKEVISKYGIEKLPAVIVTGELDKLSLSEFELNNDALILNDVSAPYLDLSSNEIKGLVEVIEIIDSSCENCVQLGSIPLGLGEAGVSITDWQKYEYDSKEGKEYISKYGIKEVPAILISTEIDYYEKIKQSLAALNLEDKGGFYAMHSIVPPYRNLTSNKIVGLVDLIILKDESCSECYDVNVNKQILQGLGIVTKSENIYDISSEKGQALVLKYDIKKVPMILVSSEAKEYVSFVNAWKQAGSVEDDGWFVMRKPEGLGTIKEL